MPIHLLAKQQRALTRPVFRSFVGSIDRQNLIRTEREVGLTSVISARR